MSMSIQEINTFKSFASDRVAVVMALQIESEKLLEKSGFNIFYTGVGLINASISLTKFIERMRPDRVVNLGTAGSIDYPIGSLVEVSSVMQRHPVFAHLNKELKLNSITKLPQVVCGSADYIETLSRDKHNLFNIVDMECYALAKVCQSYKIPLHSIKYITDLSNQNVDTEWKSNLNNARLKFTELLNQF